MIARNLVAALLLTVFANIADGAPVQVAVDILPVHSLVANIMDGVGTADLIVAPSASPHAHAISPSKAVMLAKADLMFWVSDQLTPWLTPAIASLAPQAISITLLDQPDINQIRFRSGGLFAAHDHGGNAGNGDRDPHFWLDPVNAKVAFNVIATGLANADPVNAVHYRANAAHATARIDHLIAEINSKLTPARGQAFIVYHDAYHHFENRFGIFATGAVSLGADAGTGARHIAKLRDAIGRSDVACIFVEPQFTPALAHTLASDTNTPIGRLDPIGTKLTPGPGLYWQLLRNLADDMVACLAPEQ